VLAHWNNSPRRDVSLHSNTIFWFRANHSLYKIIWIFYKKKYDHARSLNKSLILIGYFDNCKFRNGRRNATLTTRFIISHPGHTVSPFFLLRRQNASTHFLWITSSYFPLNMWNINISWENHCLFFLFKDNTTLFDVLFLLCFCLIRLD
jgi:hypothetical protein